MTTTTDLSPKARTWMRPVMLLVLVCAEMLCLWGLQYMQHHDVLGYDFDQTPLAYLTYELLMLGAVAVPLTALLVGFMWVFEHRARL